MNLKSFIKTQEIEFLCSEEDFGVIPEPYPASKLMPDWYKALPGKIDNKNLLENSTIKRCNPFLDAMSIGWIIPLAADIQIETNFDSSEVKYKWSFYKNMLENHSKEQITSPKVPNPSMPKPPIKFMNYWAIKVPKNYSVLFIPPLNRPDPRFTCFSGMVDCDKYFEFVNFPFQFNTPNYTGLIEMGTPIIQIIPIKRDSLIRKSKVTKFQKNDLEELDFTRRKRKSHESYYRDYIHEKKI